MMIQMFESITASALGELNDTRAVEPLKSALNDEDEYVQEAAKEALIKLGYPGQFQ